MVRRRIITARPATAPMMKGTRHPHSPKVTIPAGRLLNVPLDVGAVRRIVEHDETLLAELFRDFLPQYLLMAKDPGYWSEELERDDEMIKLVEVIWKWGPPGEAQKLFLRGVDF